MNGSGRGAGINTRTLSEVLLPQPVTGGVKTLVTPTRWVLQRLLAIGLKIRIPAFFILIVRVITPLPFEALVRRLSLGP